MSDALASVESAPALLQSPSNATIRRCVVHTDRLFVNVPTLFLIPVVGIPIFIGLVRNDPFRALTIGGLVLLVSVIAIIAINRLVLRPMRRFRYKDAAKTLGRQMKKLVEPIKRTRIWWVETPGAIAITRSDRVVIADHSTDYQHLWLSNDQLVDVHVAREASLLATASGRSMSAFLRSPATIFRGSTNRDPSRPTTIAFPLVFIELCYRLQPGGPVQTVTIPFGEDHRSAADYCAALKRLMPSA